MPLPPETPGAPLRLIRQFFHRLARLAGPPRRPVAPETKARITRLDPGGRRPQRGVPPA